jgi:hypothetical protein
MESAALPTTTGGAPAPPPAVAAAPARQGPPPRRQLRNYLLDASLQLRLASYLLAAATALSLGLGALLYQAYRETSTVISLADPSGSIAQALAREDRGRIVLVSAALILVLGCLVGAAVVITHRIAGPAFVLARTCREIREGKLAPPRPLRRRDLLVDLADDVAGMVDALRLREGSERDAIVAALTTLRDPGASPAARAIAAAELERLASDKEARLRS